MFNALDDATGGGTVGVDAGGGTGGGEGGVGGAGVSGDSGIDAELDGEVGTDAADAADAADAEEIGTDAADAADAADETNPSCMGLDWSCGSLQNDECCAASFIPGGSFDLVNDQEYPATISDFRMDLYEVTVGRFRRFLEAGKGTQEDPPADHSGANPNLSGSGWKSEWNSALVADTTSLRAWLVCASDFSTWSDDVGGNENRPINCVTWFEAFSFCIWDGGRLATEAEWNYAAAGGSEQRVYPWSVPPDSTVLGCPHASYWCNANSCGNGVEGCQPTDIIVVGSKPLGNGKWNQADLGGNLWEWVLDFYSGAPYLDGNQCVDCANLIPETMRVIRGGSYLESSHYLKTSSNWRGTPSSRSRDAGIRCVRDP